MTYAQTKMNLRNPDECSKNVKTIIYINYTICHLELLKYSNLLINAMSGWDSASALL